MRHGMAMARSADPMSYASVVTFVYFPGIAIGVVRPDDRAVREDPSLFGFCVPDYSTTTCQRQPRLHGMRVERPWCVLCRPREFGKRAVGGEAADRVNDRCTRGVAAPLEIIKGGAQFEQSRALAAG